MADWTYADVPSQAGKVILVTGANQGLGLSLVKDFFRADRLPEAKQPAKLIIASRSRQKAEAAIQENEVLRAQGEKIEFLELDLANLSKVRTAAEELHKKVSKLDCLVLNAGLLPPDKRETTVDGHETAFGACHLGHFLFTKLVWDLLLKADGGHARVVPVSSVAHKYTKMKTGFELVEDPQFEKTAYDKMEIYCRVKLANLLFSKQLARRAGTYGQSIEQLGSGGQKPARVTSVSLSPGFGNSGLYRDFGCMMKIMCNFMSADCDTLSKNTMRAATDLSLSSGCYLTPKLLDFYGPPTVVDSTPISQNEELAKRLWDDTEKLLGERFEP